MTAKRKPKRAEPLSLEALRADLAYDPDTGVFRWLARRPGVQTGKVAGARHSKGYIVIAFGRLFFAHRLAWFLSYGTWPERQIDHINGDKADNRISNLRLATNQQNHWNKPTPINNTSGVKGVYWFKPDKKWKAQMCINGKCVVLGYFIDFGEAVKCRMAAEEKYHGEWQYGAADAA